MVEFIFQTAFEWWGPNEDCRHCAPVLYAFRPSIGRSIYIPSDAAAAAEAAGAGHRVVKVPA